MNKKIALFVAYAFVLGQVFTPAIANAQSDNTSNAKVVVSDDLLTDACRDTFFRR